MKTSFFIVFATSVVLLLGTNVRGEYLEDRQSDQTVIFINLIYLVNFE